MPDKSDTITVTELARNLATVIDRVRVSSTRLSITRGSQVVAQLCPVVAPRMTLGELAEFLQRRALGRDDRRDYATDVQRLRAAAGLPRSPWE